MKIFKNDYAKKLLIVSLIFIIDRITKIYISNIFINSQIQEITITNFLSINLIWNQGIAFGLLNFNNDVIYNFITIIIFFISIIILILALKNQNYTSYFFTIILGGALGNLYDRINLSAVPDFIDIHIGNYHWFIFNVADIFISIGVICLIFDELFLNKKKNEKN